MPASVSPPPLKRRRLTQSQCVRSQQQTVIQTTGVSRMRIYSWNVNGLAPFLQPSIASFFGSKGGQASRSEEVDRPSLRNVLRRYSWPEMLLLQEVKINPDDTASQRAVEKAVSRATKESNEEPSYRAFFCLPKDKYNARGFRRKVYGVCSIIREDFVNNFKVKIREVDWDLEGRFLICETEARIGVPKLAVFNCYMVNGTEAPYKNSTTGKMEGTRHDKKLRVHELLQAECRALEKEGVSVVLAGDMNVARSKLDGHPNLRMHPIQHCVNRADFEAKFFHKVEDRGLEMIDTFRELHPNQAGYTYYPRQGAFGSSCDRVDLIMLSKILRPCLEQAGLKATTADRGPSDHIPLYVELEFAPSAGDGEEAAPP